MLETVSLQLAGNTLDNLTPEEYAFKHEAKGVSNTKNLTLQTVWKTGIRSGISDFAYKLKSLAQSGLE